MFADDARRPRIAIKNGADLIFEQRALLLDHHNEIEAVREFAHDHRIERPHHADFEQTQAERRAVVGEAEIAKRLQEVLPGLAGGDHTDPRLLAVADDLVEAVGARVSERGRELVVVKPLFLSDGRIDGARPEAPGRIAWPFGDDDLRPLGPDINGAAAFGDVSNHLHANPTAGKPRHGYAMQAKIKQFLGVGRIDDRHADGDEQGVGEIDCGRRFRAVIVASERQRAALGRGAREIGVAQGVGGSVDARSLAVPDPEHAIDCRVGKVIDLLGAPNRRRGEVLVETRAEDDVVLLKLRRRAPQLDVITPER